MLSDRHAAFALAAATVVGAPASSEKPTGVTIEQLVEVTDIGSLSISPDGRTIAFRTERGDIGQNHHQLAWYAFDLGSRQLLALGDGGDPIYADPGLIESEPAIWSPDSQAIFHRLLSDGAIGIWRTPLDGSVRRSVVTGEANVEQVVDRDGSALDYSLGPPRQAIADAERHEYEEGILVDKHVDLAQNLFRGALINGRRSSQRLTGKWFHRAGLLWRQPRQWFRLDLATLRSAGLPSPDKEQEGGNGHPLSGLRSARGDLAFLDSAAAKVRVEIVAGKRKLELRCELPECEDSRPVAIAWRPDRPELVVTFKDPFHAFRLIGWDIERNSLRLIATSEGVMAGGRSGSLPCVLTGDAAICVTASTVSPPKLESIDLENGRREVLFDPNFALSAIKRPEPVRIDLEVPGAGRLTGVLLLPDAASRPMPLFITYYRCEGFIRGGEGDEWPYIPLADAGIATACLNSLPVGEGQYGAERYERALRGITALIDRLATDGLVDRQRIGMGGFSFGSEVTTFTAIHSNLLAAASIASPQIEYGYYWFNSARGRDQPAKLREVFGLGRPEDTPDVWQYISPALNAARFTAPLLIQIPEHEARHVAELSARLSNSPTPFELYAFPEEPHYKLQPRHKLSVYRRNFDWFRYWLQGKVDPTPTKMDQYLRWNELRVRRETARSAP